MENKVKVNHDGPAGYECVGDEALTMPRDVALHFVRSPYNYDVDMVSNDTGLDCSGDKGRTQQSFKQEVDINHIVKMYGITGKLPENVPQVLQGDFEEVVDFQSAMNLIVKARESFDAMPADVRSRFDNDPHKFLEFTSNPANFDEAVKFGLIRPEVAQARKEKAEQVRKAEIEARAKEMAAAAAAKAQGTT